MGTNNEKKSKKNVDKQTLANSKKNIKVKQEIIKDEEMTPEPDQIEVK